MKTRNKSDSIKMYNYDKTQGLQGTNLFRLNYFLTLNASIFKSSSGRMKFY